MEIVTHRLAEACENDTHSLTSKCWIAKVKIIVDTLELPYHIMQLQPQSSNYLFHQLLSRTGPTSCHRNSLLSYF